MLELTFNGLRISTPIALAVSLVGFFPASALELSNVEQARRADGFVEAIGVNVHLS